MKRPAPRHSDRIVPFVAMYLCGVATSAGVSVLGDRASLELVASAASAAAVPSIADRLTASHRELLPGVSAPSHDDPVRVPIDAVVMSIAVPSDSRAPAAEATSDGPSATSTSGSVMALEAPARGTDAEVGRTTRRERSVGVLSGHGTGPSLEPSQIRGVLATHMPSLRRCYERASRRQGFGAEERIELELHIARGAVQSASVSGASSSTLGQCVSTAARSWSFPEGSATVSLPVRLRPQEG